MPKSTLFLREQEDSIGLLFNKSLAKRDSLNNLPIMKLIVSNKTNYLIYS